MKCVVIFGPSAVGKAAVGKKLADMLGFKLFHNHMVIELVYNFFTWNDDAFGPLITKIRNQIFEKIKNSKIKGIVFTYVWALDQEEDHKELMEYMSSLGIDLQSLFFVELEADQDIRLLRNKEQERLIEKKTKRNISESENFLLESERRHKLNSENDFFYPELHLKIDNSYLDVDATAEIILDRLNNRGFV
ncbi:AAA family ATPase [Spirochaeta africana]|uniref:Shikimate kinase n=1 Tax=Spirochaeta africana (strain ATCC 700263 / DSM 8902 / Z-7692) TaxID=889378 RepID=H9UHW4_SPIAZ|nr:AAA family ATPase [Spirochaeta africana]AFG37107.1 hypothetical protein Spiaf_1020 [Spirochaeta africana DSM 8902]